VSAQYILYTAIAVFVLMMIGLLLTAREFKQMIKQNSSADRGKDVHK
jgi:Flp pilus assembly protein protease CpaA